MYEKFVELVQNAGIKVSDVAKGTGISAVVFSEWKKGKSTPKLDKLQKIAAFFSVPVTYFTGENSSGAIYLDDETKELLDVLRQRPEMRTLFKVSKNASKDDIETAVKIIEKFKTD